jgi:RNA polymerase sigma-70 factor (ECF subfamily)
MGRDDLRSRGGGEPDGAERLHRLYEDSSPDLFAFLLRRCPTAEDAADCLAETFRIAWEKRDSVPAGEQARPWLFGVARNVARRARVSGERAAAASQELALAAERAGAGGRQADDEVAAALAQLTPLDREIVTMLSWDGLSPREVAPLLGLSANVVRVRAHRARQRLRMLLAPPADALAATAPETYRRSP